MLPFIWAVGLGKIPGGKMKRFVGNEKYEGIREYMLPLKKIPILPAGGGGRNSGFRGCRRHETCKKEKLFKYFCSVVHLFGASTTSI